MKDWKELIIHLLTDMQNPKDLEKIYRLVSYYYTRLSPAKISTSLKDQHDSKK